MMLLLFVYSADHPEIKLVVAATCDTKTGGDGREKGGKRADRKIEEGGAQEGGREMKV